VVTNVGGNPELVRDGVDGLLVARSDVDGFAAAFHRLLTSPALACRMGASGAARVRDHFLLSDTIQRYQEIYARSRSFS
jgi:glycosyltransferase involved in cell wall biosynthesis